MKRCLHILLLATTIISSALVFEHTTIDVQGSTNEELSDSESLYTPVMGDVFVIIDEDIYSEEVAKVGDDIKIKVKYGCNMSNEMIEEGTSARFVITSDHVNINDDPVVYEDISDGKCSRDKDLTYVYSFNAKDIMSYVGEIKFEMQLINKAGEVDAFANRSIYYAIEGDEIYFGGGSFESAVNYLTEGQNVYYDNVMRMDRYDVSFWVYEEEKLIYFFDKRDSGNSVVHRFPYQKQDKNIVVKDSDGHDIYTIEYVKDGEMKINDTVFYGDPPKDYMSDINNIVVGVIIVVLILAILFFPRPRNIENADKV